MAAENRLDYLRKQFTKIDEETFCKIVACDTTTTKKYASWLLRLYSKSNLNLDNLNDAIQAIELFDSLKDSLPKEYRDINTFQSINALLFSINSWLIKRFNENENTVSFLKKGAELLFENEDIFIVKLLSFEGSVNYGSNTKWCTLLPGTFVEYSSKGPLYIIQCKTDKYRDDFSDKSQLYFPSGEYRNSLNTAIDLIKIAIKNPELYNCFSFIKDIKGINKDTDLFTFFNLNIVESSAVVDVASRFGIKTLSFLEKFNKDLLDDLFEHFGEKAFNEIPHSEEKLISFVSKVENGLCLSYSKKGKGYNAEEKDYIAEFIEKHKRTASKLSCYTNCTEQGWDVKLFMRTFDIYNIAYYEDIIGKFVHIKNEVTGKEYHKWDVVKLMKEAELAFSKKYIREDKYVDYPSYLSYLDFVKLLESGEYKSC